MISENFIVARELVHHLSSSLSSTALLKLDFFKAFDSLNWNFLFAVLHERGFPPLFSSWIKLLLTTSESAVLINGVEGPRFQHCRGVRQGDPLSPFLFILAVDVLPRLLQLAAAQLQASLSDRFTMPFCLLQYADDTLIFTSAEEQAVRTLHSILCSFSAASGLQINRCKSSFVPFNLDASQLNLFDGLFNYQLKEFPLQYLGLPLTPTKPDRACFQHLLEKITSKLDGWRGRLLSRAGRLTLVSSVLSAIPGYCMSVFSLPSWLLSAIDKARRNFLWGNTTTGSKRINLLSWSRVCMPKSVGGLGVKDLKLHNRALLLRWIWRLYTSPASLWSQIATSLYANARGSASPIVWNRSGSFFWRDIRALFIFFQLSTRVEIQGGKNTSFWFDNWGGKPLCWLLPTAEQPPRPKLNFRDGWRSRLSLLPSPPTLQVSAALDSVTTTGLLSSNHDTISWFWSTNGAYSASSVYNALATFGKSSFPLIPWKLRVPPSVQLFLVLLAHDRLLTRQQLSRRNIVHLSGCMLCNQPILEDSLHLFFHCDFVNQLWTGLRGTNSFCLHTVSSLSAREALLSSLCSLQQQQPFLCTTFATMLWSIWLERNNRIFRGCSRDTHALATWVRVEAALFFRNC